MSNVAVGECFPPSPGRSDECQSAPWIEKVDRISTSALITAQTSGIHVDMRKPPALYTAPRLGPSYQRGTKLNSPT